MDRKKRRKKRNKHVSYKWRGGGGLGRGRGVYCHVYQNVKSQTEGRLSKTCVSLF